MNEFLLQLEVGVAIPLVTGLIGIGVAYTIKRFGLQADSTANAAIQAAVGNFAGKVAGDLVSGKITGPTALPALKEHLESTVSESMARFPITNEALVTMLLGKAAAVAGVPIPHSAAGVQPSPI